MPQMMPINWMISFMFFIFIFILFNILNYYIFNYKSFNKKKNNIMSFKPLYWKW